MIQTKFKFNRREHPEFYSDLRVRVAQYFKENNLSKYANSEMKLKSFVMMSLFFIPYGVIMSGVLNQSWLFFGMWVLMGFGSTGIGMSIMHDANHGAYSKNKRVNAIMAFSINLLGSNSASWRIQHNFLHHSFTNIQNGDLDIENPVMRLSRLHDSKWYFKYQAYYAPILYSIMTLYWLFTEDFDRIMKFSRTDLLRSAGLTFKGAIINALFHKIWYLILFLVLPILIVDLPWWQVVLGFLSMHIISGLFLACSIQPSHVQENTSFFEANKEGEELNNWAIHQLKTTTNFGKCNGLISWFLGGLDYQVEHHLFPKICHIHYPQISKIVKQTALEYNLPYLEHKNYLHAVKSHFKHLNSLAKE